MKFNNGSIAILREAKNTWERRTPIVPSDVKKLIRKGIQVLVQPSSKRIFTNQEYQMAGAEITTDISQAHAIFGVKQFPYQSIIPSKTYSIFSHVIKAQEENMNFLDSCLYKNVRLFDYECVRLPANNHTGQRLISFGEFAGMAGMVDSLRGVGEQLISRGLSTWFLGSSYMYPSVSKAFQAVSHVGKEIFKYGLPKEISPFIFAFTGKGNVNKGVKRIFELLPHKYISKSELENFYFQNFSENDRKFVYCVDLDVCDLVEPIHSSTPHTKHNYYSSPHLFKPVFHQKIAPYISVLINGMYQDPRFPRLLTRNQIQTLQNKSLNNLLFIGDISCDVNGSIEFLDHTTTIDNPFFVYDPKTNSNKNKIDGSGIAILAIDNLPAEFPRESSQFFSSALMPFVEALSKCDAKKSLDKDLMLPEEFKNACITSNGNLTPKFRYIQSLRDRNLNKFSYSKDITQKEAFILKLEGHIFDHNVINQILDLAEYFDLNVKIINFDNGGSRNIISSALLQISCSTKTVSEKFILKMRSLSELNPLACIKLTQFSLKEINLKKKVQNEKIDYVLDENILKNNAFNKMNYLFKNIQKSHIQKKILVLGFGYVSMPLVDYLSMSGNNQIIIASNNIDHARKLVRHSNVDFLYLNANQKSQVNQVIKSCSPNLIVSLLPAEYHFIIAQLCINYKINMINASYITPDILKHNAINNQALKANVTILCEVGLDPGLDHMNIMMELEKLRNSGEQLISLESYCGGLPSPEAALSNPLSYKFSQNPIGLLLSLKSGARYLKNNKVYEINPKELLNSKNVEPFNFFSSLNLEAYPNRDSIKYIDIYSLPDSIKTIYRGTLRYKGFSEIMKDFIKLGLLSNSNIPLDKFKGNRNNWAEILNFIISQQNVEISEANFLNNRSLFLKEKLKSLGIHHTTINFMDQLEMINFEPNNFKIIAKNDNLMNLLCELLQNKLSYKEDERDMVLMYNKLCSIKTNGQKNITLKEHNFRLILYGEDQQNQFRFYSSMSKCVGLPIAICSQMLLDDKIQTKGVLRPILEEIYKPCLDQLKQFGIEFLSNS